MTLALFVLVIKIQAVSSYLITFKWVLAVWLHSDLISLLCASGFGGGTVKNKHQKMWCFATMLSFIRGKERSCFTTPLTERCLQLLWMRGESTVTGGSRSCWSYQWVDGILSESFGFYKRRRGLQFHLLEIGLRYFNKHLLFQTDLAVHITPTTTCHISNSIVYFSNPSPPISHTLGVLAHSSLPWRVWWCDLRATITS